MTVLKRLSLLIITFSPTALAESEGGQDLGLMQVVTPLLLVITLIFILAWMVRKLNAGAPALGQGIKILASTPLTSQARICLIRVGGKDILVGVTSQQVNRLHTFDEAIETPAAPGNTNDLARQFKKLLKGDDQNT